MKRSKCFGDWGWARLTCCVFFITFLASGASQPPRRLHGNIENYQTFTLPGNIEPFIAQAQDQGEVEDSLPLLRLTMHFALTAAQQADRQQLAAGQVTRKSSEYHKWLTPEEYGARFGLNASDLAQISAWLAQQGFAEIETARSRTSISFSGRAAQVQAAFRTAIHHYRINGESHYANSRSPLLPKALQGIVAGIRGLNDIRPKPQAHPQFTSSVSGSHFLVPYDFATIYDIQPLYGSGMYGTGQKIAIVGQSDIDLNDIRAFRVASGLPPNDPQVILAGDDPGTVSDGEVEADLDIEWAGGIAPNATILYVNSTSAFHSLFYTIENNLAPVVSISYAVCEVTLSPTSFDLLNSMFQQATIQGMTLVAGSGDWGASGCDKSNPSASGIGVYLPASSPYVTGVGGTMFVEGAGSYWDSTNNTYGGSALGYIPETAWNETGVSQLAASSGGASIHFPKPDWQAGPGVPNDAARDVPDVAFTAASHHDGYIFCSQGSCVNGFRGLDQSIRIVGGVSASTPSFAGILALLNQQMNSAQGNINPTLYALASFSTDVFHDITTGNNIVPCAVANTTLCPNPPGQIGYSAGPGYDQVTGLGSIDAYNLIREWNGDFRISADPTSLSITRGAGANVQVNVVGQSNFKGTVSFTCSVSGGLTNTTCAIPGTVSGSGTATLTVSTGAVATAPIWRWPQPPVWLIALPASLVYIVTRKRQQLAPVAFVLLFLITTTSCGDGGGSSSVTSVFAPRVQTGTVTVTATSGLLSENVTVSVTVQ